MKQINGYWVDENDNRWNIKTYTEEEAERYSKSLVNCYYCYNCIDCHNCFNCFDCVDCSDCRYCWNCRYYKQYTFDLNLIWRWRK